MYQPAFNKVLVEIDDADAQWGGENNENMLGKSYSKGKAITIGPLLETKDYPTIIDQLVTAKDTRLDYLIGKDIMWNEGTEAGTTFEEDGKLYGLIYWWDIVGIKG